MPPLLSRASLGATPGACLCIQHTQIADPLLRTRAQTVQKARAWQCRKPEGAADGQWPFSCCCWLPPPPDFNLAIDQTNKRRPSILTRQISHLHRSTAGFQIANLGGFHRQSQGWISMGPASTDFTGPDLNRGSVWNKPLTEQMTTRRKEIGRKNVQSRASAWPWH